MADKPDWLTDGYPELRASPPWVMQEMIEAQPELLEGIATGSDTAALALLLRGPGPHFTAGCGTSEHGALAVAEILTEAGIPVTSLQAFEAALDPPRNGSLIAVSHSGSTWATTEAMKAARKAGAATGLITAAPDRAASAQADGVLATPFEDRSWCHTVGYTSPIGAGLALAAATADTEVPAGAVRDLATAGVAARDGATHVAASLANCGRIILVGSGADRIAARELTLKIEEASYIPSAMRELETFLHGHLPACNEDTGLVLIHADRRAAGGRTDRAVQLLRAARRVGMRTAAITTGGLPDDLLSAGRIEAPSSDGLPAAAAALLGTAAPLQWLAHELAIQRGTNPDLIRRDQALYREAADSYE
jgi:glucosamine--fructose-6-phosphate aminotransferase (isomerizing)